MSFEILLTGILVLFITELSSLSFLFLDFKKLRNENVIFLLGFYYISSILYIAFILLPVSPYAVFIGFILPLVSFGLIYGAMSILRLFNIITPNNEEFLEIRKINEVYLVDSDKEKWEKYWHDIIIVYHGLLAKIVSIIIAMLILIITTDYPLISSIIPLIGVLLIINYYNTIRKSILEYYKIKSGLFFLRLKQIQEEFKE